MNLTGPDALEVATLHEEVQSLLGQGKYPEARRKAEELLRRRPNFPAALNNIGLTYFAEGLLEQAIASTRRTLETDREAIGFDVWTKKAEALSCLGDDQAVLDLLQEFQQTARPQGQPASPFFLHLAAVAAFRLGGDNEARRHWEAALRRQPGFAPARANLDDLRKPVGERHAPWPFPFNYWVTKELLGGLIAHYKQAQPADPKQADGPRTADSLQAHPELAVLVPALLDRGDPAGREFALRTALAAKTPEMLAALRDFALGQRGPDAMRSEAAQAAVQAGLLPPGPIRLWLRGEWREILLFGWEVTGEPLNAYQHSQQVQDLEAEALEAMR